MSKPEFFGYRPFGEVDQFHALIREMIDIQREGGATWFRVTYFDDEHPSPLYQHGIYVEGWTKQPDEQPPFNFPLTEASPPQQSTPKAPRAEETP